MKDGKLYIYVEEVYRGFVIKTNSKEKEGEKPKTIIAKSLDDLEEEICMLIEGHFNTRTVSFSSELKTNTPPLSFGNKY